MPRYTLYALASVIILTFGGQTWASQDSLNLRRMECRSIFNSIGEKSPSTLPEIHYAPTSSQKNTSWQDGADYAQVWLKERMNPRYQMDPQVQSVVGYYGARKFEAIEAASEAANYIISRSTFSELQRFLTDLEFASGFADYIKSKPKIKMAWYFKSFKKGFKERPINGEMFQKMARTFFAYQYIMKLPAEAKFYSISEFSKLASIEGLKPEKFPSLFRLDSRDVEQIIASHGFYPNPKHSRGILADHSSPQIGSMGAGFVSASFEAGNRANLAVWPIISAAKTYSFESSVISQIFPEFNGGYLWKRLELTSRSAAQSNLMAPRMEVLKTFEYEINDVVGVRPHKELSIESEKEVVLPFVESTQIKRVREIYILAEVIREKSGALYEFVVVDSRLNDWAELGTSF